jgi:hypothetical protein
MQGKNQQGNGQNTSASTRKTHQDAYKDTQGGAD